MLPRLMLEQSRITPACAGKTVMSRLFITFFRDHPRLRGENNCLPPQLGSLPGSPPLARGKQFIKIRSTQHLRITPACAGKTGCCLTCICKDKDHPRLRGENFQLVSLQDKQIGSPPLARGKH